MHARAAPPPFFCRESNSLSGYPSAEHNPCPCPCSTAPTDRADPCAQLCQDASNRSHSPCDSLSARNPDRCGAAGILRSQRRLRPATGAMRGGAHGWRTTTPKPVRGVGEGAAVRLAILCMRVGNRQDPPPLRAPASLRYTTSHRTPPRHVTPLPRRASSSCALLTLPLASDHRAHLLLEPGDP